MVCYRMHTDSFNQFNFDRCQQVPTSAGGSSSFRFGTYREYDLVTQISSIGTSIPAISDEERLGFGA